MWTQKANPKEWDVLLSRRCNPGVTAFVHKDLKCAVGQNLVILRADGTTVYPPFLRWLTQSPQWWREVCMYQNSGAVFDSLKCKDIPNFQINLPPLEEQKRIAHILSSLDDKIELNRQTNQTLEAMAQALFTSWFVDFEPFGRVMPSDWKEGVLGDLITVKYGKDHKKLSNGIYPVYGSGGNNALR